MSTITKKKVLMLVNGPLSNSGVPNVVLTIIEQLHKSVDFTLMATKGGILDETFKSYGVQIVYINKKKYRTKIMRAIYGYVFVFKDVANQLKKVLQSNKFDAIHCCSGYDGGLYMKIANKQKVGVRILHCQANFSQRKKTRIEKLLIGQEKWFKKLIERYATIKLTSSKSTGQDCFLSVKNMKVLINPVDILYYSNINKVNSNAIRILQIGTFNENKNQLFSLEILKEVLNRGIEASLTFIGYDINSNYGQKLTSFIKENELSKNVTLLPANANKREVFKETDVLLLPSHTEACPLVALEAQATNTPVIASKNVPTDVNFGLCEFISFDNKEDWISSIANIKAKKFILNKEFSNITPKIYGERIYKLYHNE